MGATNAKLVYRRWSHLPDRAFRALAYMALTSIDDDPEPSYYEGREKLVHALGRQLPPEPADSDESARAEEYRRGRRADFEAVKTALRQLMKAGVLVLEKPSAPNRNAQYRLLLNAPTGKAEPVEQGRLSLLTGKAEPVEQGRLSLPQRKLAPLKGGEPQSQEQRGKSPRVG